MAGQHLRYIRIDTSVTDVAATSSSIYIGTCSARFRASKIVYLLLLTVIQFGSLYLAPYFCSTVFSLLPQSLIATFTARQATLCKPYKLFMTMLKEVTSEAFVAHLAMLDSSFW